MYALSKCCIITYAHVQYFIIMYVLHYIMIPQGGSFRDGDIQGLRSPDMSHRSRRPALQKLLHRKVRTQAIFCILHFVFCIVSIFRRNVIYVSQCFVVRYSM